jgi:hypothetical protein
MKVLQYWPHRWYKVYFNKVLKWNSNTFILMIGSLPFTINVTNLTIPSFVSWFRILSQYGEGITFLLGFGRAMQYPSKFHGESTTTKIMQILYLNSIILFKLHFTINVNRLCNTLIYLNHYICHDIMSTEKIYKKHSFVSWFRILSQNDEGIAFLLSFAMVMQYPSKFQNIWCGAQRFYRIPWEGYFMWIE